MFSKWEFHDLSTAIPCIHFKFSFSTDEPTTTTTHFSWNFLFYFWRFILINILLLIDSQRSNFWMKTLHRCEIRSSKWCYRCFNWEMRIRQKKNRKQMPNIRNTFSRFLLCDFIWIVLFVNMKKRKKKTTTNSSQMTIYSTCSSFFEHFFFLLWIV